MKAILLGLLMTSAAFAQVSNPSIVPVSVAPTGSCTQTLPIELKTPDGTIYTCQNGTWGPIGGGGASFPSGSSGNLLYYPSSGTSVAPLTLGSNLAVLNGSLQSLTPGLIAEWNLTQPTTATTFSDLSGNGNTLTLATSPNTPAVTKAGLVFGGSQYATAPAINPAQITVMIAIEATKTSGGVIEQNSSGVGWTLLNLGGSVPYYQFITSVNYPASSVIESLSDTAAENAWQTIAFTCDGSTTMNLYANGHLSATQAANCTMGTSTSLTYLGRRAISTSYMSGAVAFVMIWSRVLSANEIASANAYIAAQVAPAGITLPPPQLPALTPNGLAALPPMGWNSWYAYNTSVTEANIKANADAMVSNGMKNAGYQYVNIDAIPTTRSGSVLVPTTPSNWPDGFSGTSTYVHGDGLKFGFYSSPNTSNGCVGGAQASGGFESQDASTFASWGVDFLKYDWCGAQSIYGSNPIGVQTGFQKMASDLRATGRSILYSLSDGSLSMYAYMPIEGANMSRMGADATNWTAINNLFDASWATISPYAGPGHWIDLDLIQVGNGLTDAQGQTQMSFWALMSAPLIESANLTGLTANSKATLTNPDIIAVDQDALGIPGFRGSSVTCGTATCEVWVKQISGGNWVLDLVNRDSAAHSITATFAGLGLKGSWSDSKNLWGNWPSCGWNGSTLVACAIDAGAQTTSYTAASVPAYGSVVLELIP